MGRRLSEKQILRRTTILSTARQLVEERGYNGFTMQDLADRSGVALKTLYDIYGSKSSLLAQAVEERARIVFADMDAAGERVGFDRLLMIAEHQWQGAFEVPNLTRAVAPIFATQPGAFAIEDIYMRYHRRGVQEIADAGDLAEWARVDFLVRMMMVSQAPITLMWARNEISSEEVFDFTVMMICQVLYPAARGATRNTIEGLLEATYRKLGSWNPAPNAARDV